MDEKYIRMAIDLAFQARVNGNEPFGAVLVKDDEVMHTNENDIRTKTDNTRHAELGLISDYCQKEGIANLEGYSLYSSAEPCFMCSGAIYWSKISKLVYSVPQVDLMKFSGGTKKLLCSDIVNSGNRNIEIIGGV